MEALAEGIVVLFFSVLCSLYSTDLDASLLPETGKHFATLQRCRTDP